ncbi:hypothetical protein HCH_02215 [Hahella chejuensis KCTC 2396]|uniref:Uncharacterized protein n=1 Tax=Hahella chejuensis (strain KCTC 2396) TaxID=349521 RepID=Q2SJY1_HAHCH|nr:hypothetical protein HCH_02215 [Hahella chejuensis KCTC 2396]
MWTANCPTPDLPAIVSGARKRRSPIEKSNYQAAPACLIMAFLIYSPNAIR